MKKITRASIEFDAKKRMDILKNDIKDRRIIEVLAAGERVGIAQDDIQSVIERLGLDAVEYVLYVFETEKAARGYFTSPYYGRVTRLHISDIEENGRKFIEHTAAK